MDSLTIYPDGVGKLGLTIPTASGFVARVASAVSDENVRDAERVAKVLNIIVGLEAVVQYRGKRGNAPFDWRAMAAFDLRSRADSYCVDCNTDNKYWEYRVVDILLER
jgi:hypothetical protein